MRCTRILLILFGAFIFGARAQGQVTSLTLNSDPGQNADAPVPIIILDPIDSDTFTTGGTPIVQIVGGSSKSIQVNSDNTSAANIFGGATVDLTQGGPDFNGSSFGVDGGPNTAPDGFITANAGAWLQPQLPIADPFASIVPPADPGLPAASPNVVAPAHCTSAGNPCPVLGAGGAGSAAQVAGCPLEPDAALFECDGCPDPGGCIEYGPGDYSGGIQVQNQTAIFAPGVYYIEGGTLDFHANGFVRLADPTQSPGDGSLGTIFVLTCITPGKCTSGTEATILIGANSGKSSCPAGAGQVACFPTVRVHCPGDGPFDPNLALPIDLPGNVLLAPCTNDGTYPGAPQVGGIGPVRGILFWQDRSASASDSLSGGAGLLLDGTMYFHDCPNSPVCGNPPAEQTTNITLVGGSGSNTRILGGIVTDQLTLKGNSLITMELNP